MSDRDGTVTRPRLAPRRSATVRSWWAKSFGRAVEESAFNESDLRSGRTWARRGAVGGIAVAAGRAVAAVDEGDDTWTVQVDVPVLDADAADALVEVISSGAGWIGSLLRGELPHALLEATEEVGVELLPYGGELATTCACPTWSDPCPHALAVLTQLTWWVDEDPFVLTHLRGLGREELLARLHAVDVGIGGTPGSDDGPVLGEDDDLDLVVAVEAAERAAAMLEEFDPAQGPETGPGRRPAN